MPNALLSTLRSPKTWSRLPIRTSQKYN